MLSRWTVEASLVAAVWLVAIALNLVAVGFYDIAVRDVVMAVGAYTLACLTAAHEAVSQSDAVTQRFGQTASVRAA
jgi:hypothetical protein